MVRTLYIESIYIYIYIYIHIYIIANQNEELQWRLYIGISLLVSLSVCCSLSELGGLA